MVGPRARHGTARGATAALARRPSPPHGRRPRVCAVAVQRVSARSSSMRSRSPRASGSAITLALGDRRRERRLAACAAAGSRRRSGVSPGSRAAYAMLVVVVLVARFGPLERAIGQDRLVRWHRPLGPWPLYLLAAHATLIVDRLCPRRARRACCTSSGSCSGPIPASSPRPSPASLLIAAGVSSYRIARRRMAYETWWSVHLYTYLALFLSFSHQIHTGASFVGHPRRAAWWTALWICTLALVLACRVALPLCRSLRHRVTVDARRARRARHVLGRPARPAADRLPDGRRPVPAVALPAPRAVVAGAPVLAVGRADRVAPADHGQGPGDHSAALARLSPARASRSRALRRVHRRRRAHATASLLVGAGVGITPIRALLEELPERRRRARRPARARRATS